MLNFSNIWIRNSHLPPITKTIQVRWARHAGHCWRSRDELISDVLLWTPTHDRAKAGRPARTYIQQLCEDTGCCPEDLPRAMNDREEWRERVWDIRATSAIWWWWYIYIYIYIYIYWSRDWTHDYRLTAIEPSTKGELVVCLNPPKSLAPLHKCGMNQFLNMNSSTKITFYLLTYL